MPTVHGAPPKVWAQFKRLAFRDLLPVVSDPEPLISPKSRMKQKGKTPSLINGQGFVSGFPDWTNHEATARDIDVWKAAGYGICIQTRELRALAATLAEGEPLREYVDRVFSERSAGERDATYARLRSARRVAIAKLRERLSGRSVAA